MGKVYLAARADDAYQQQVAIKLMRADFGHGEAMMVRFSTERQILVNLNHPNIARLLDGGMPAEGLPYLVMEYVKGVPLDEYCRQGRIRIERRLQLFCTVCAAVEYAHKNLVVHRDIKPANILVTAEGVPKLLDFGIAKLLDGELGNRGLTQADERLMTPDYASPEQLRGEPITTATDVYALGVLLYELLTGRRPFELKTTSPLEVVKVICEKDPPLPSVTVLTDEETAPPDAARRLRGDLDNIVLMAMRKEPARRYSSVAALSSDVVAHLDGYPVRARSDTWRYRSSKFIHRHKAGVFATAGVVLALAVFSVGMGLLARRATREQSIAKQEEEFLATMFRAATPDEARGRTLTARELLDRGAQRVDQLAAQPIVQASLLHDIAQAYLDLGLYDQAELLAERSYNLRARNLGPRNPQTADTLELLATVLRDKAEYQKAEPLFRQLLAIREEASGTDQRLIAHTLADLGDCLGQEEKDVESEAVLRRALAIYHHQDPDNGSEARLYLAWVLERKGNFPGASQLLQEAVEIDRRTKGAYSPDYANSLHNLASDLIDLGDLSGAEAKLRETLAIRRKILGNDNPDLTYTLNNLGYVLLEKGDWQAAEPLLQENLALGLRRLGPNHPRVARFLNNWARVLQEKGNYTEAEENYRRALDGLRQAGQRESWAAAQVMSNLGMLDFDRNRYSEAESWARQALEMRRKLGGEQTPALASSLVELAEDRVFQGDPQSAVPMLHEALGIRQQKYSAGHPAVISAQVRLGEALTDEGEVVQAERVLRQAFASARTAPFPLLPWQMAETESALGACLIALHRYPEGQVLLRDSEPGLRTHPGATLRRMALRRPAKQPPL